LPLAEERALRAGGRGGEEEGQGKKCAVSHLIESRSLQHDEE
jgi:hypothetical protein